MAHGDFLPYPEIVDRRSGVYRILDSTARDTSGSVDQVHRRLWVPLREDGRAVVRHEMAHISWSPLRLPRVDYPIVVLHAVEDARINLGLANASLPVLLDPEQRAHIQLLALRDLKSGRAADFTLRWVASLGTNVEPDLAAVADATAGDSATTAARLVAGVRARLDVRRRRGPLAPFKVAVVAARDLARALAANGALDPRFRDIALEISCCSVRDDEDATRARLPLARGEGDGGGDETGSGSMSIVEAPLDLVHPARGRGLRRDWRAAVEGSHPGALHRWAVDRAVFRRPCRRVGGSVLLDTSGSMRLDADDLDTIFDASRGAALVAMYSGSGDHGELRIVARAGRRASRSHLERFGTGNVVDVPALAWLARQPAPRFWVSDGAVTGVGDQTAPDIQRRCAEICRAAAIRRLGSVGEAAEQLASGGRATRGTVRRSGYLVAPVATARPTEAAEGDRK